MKWLIPIGLALLLGACDLPALTTTTNNLQGAGDAYLFENIAARVWVRSECREILDAEVTQLKADGEYAEARRLLRDNYPPLVTVDLLGRLQDDDIAGILSSPPGCGSDTSG